MAILNLGFSSELYLQTLLFSGIVNGAKNPLPEGAAAADLVSQEGLDDQNVGQILANGNVLFNDNQVLLDLQESDVMSLALTSIGIVSFDDVEFNGNQCESNMTLDLVVVPTFILGLFSVRCCDNRFKESFLSGFVSQALVQFRISLFTFGIMNTTTDNQATHCILARGYPQKMIDRHNRVLWSTGCSRYGQLLENLTARGCDCSPEKGNDG